MAVGTRPDGGHSNAYLSGLHEDTEYSASTGVDYVFSESSIHSGDTFTVDIRAENVVDFAGWQFDIAFDSYVGSKPLA